MHVVNEYIYVCNKDSGTENTILRHSASARAETIKRSFFELEIIRRLKQKLKIQA